MKKCCKCKVHLTKNMFSNDRSTKDGMSSRCKACSSLAFTEAKLKGKPLNGSAQVDNIHIDVIMKIWDDFNSKKAAIKQVCEAHGVYISSYARVVLLDRATKQIMLNAHAVANNIGSMKYSTNGMGKQTYSTSYKDFYTPINVEVIGKKQRA